MIDYHVHLWPHGAPIDLGELARSRLSSYCEQAARRGVEEIAITEHLFRFEEFAPLHGRFIDRLSSDGLAPRLAGYLAEHRGASLESYTEALLAAKDAGLPLLVGLEVDYYADLMDEVVEILEGYPFDVLLGSVHFLGAWTFDDLDDPVSSAQWDERSIEEVFSSYCRAFEELCATRAFDVVAHADLVKLTGRLPDAGLRAECEARLAESVGRAGLSVEVSSAGLRKPIGEAYPSPSLLRCLHEAQVPVTVASDAHGAELVGCGAQLLTRELVEVGYGFVRTFSRRRPKDRPIVTRAAPEELS